MSQSTAAKARSRNRAHVKRAAFSDITARQELAMRRKARKCPLCGIRMRNEGGKPDSKELDHIIPINVGGTHTHGNVRIICRLCNQRRPKDGRDYTGPVTLWAQGPSPVRRIRVTCRKGLHPWVSANIDVHDGKKRCKKCRRETEGRRRPADLKQCKCGSMFAAPGNTLMCPDCTDQAARKAAELHASGMTWPKVAAAVGYGSHNGEGARYAAKRIGYTPQRLQAKPKTGNMCGCGEPAWRTGRCETCVSLNAIFAVAMRRAEGWTLQMIANELGYSSITTVTNLMKTVAPVETRMGRPSKAAASL